MILRLVISVAIIFLAFAFWVVVQESSRRFARRHPEFGPAREEGGECGVTCGCPNWKKCRERGHRLEVGGQGEEGGGAGGEVVGKRGLGDKRFFSDPVTTIRKPNL